MLNISGQVADIWIRVITPAHKGIFEATTAVVASVLEMLNQIMDRQFQRAFIPIAAFIMAMSCFTTTIVHQADRPTSLLTNQHNT